MHFISNNYCESSILDSQVKTCIRTSVSKLTLNIGLLDAGDACIRLPAGIRMWWESYKLI